MCGFTEVALIHVSFLRKQKKEHKVEKRKVKSSSERWDHLWCHPFVSAPRCWVCCLWEKEENIHIPPLRRPSTDGFNLAAFSHSWIKFRVSMIAEYPQRHRRGAKPQHYSRLSDQKWCQLLTLFPTLLWGIRKPSDWSRRIRLLLLLFWPSFILLVYSHGARLWSVSETVGGLWSHITRRRWQLWSSHMVFITHFFDPVFKIKAIMTNWC